MSVFSKVAHQAIQFYQRSSYQRFHKGLADVEAVQRRKLQTTLEYLRPYLGAKADLSDYEKFARNFPVTSYGDYKDIFNREKKSQQRTLPDIVRFQPTSGSTDTLKWIPYTRQLLKDFDNALGPWLYDFYSSYPEILHGPHYWSLSWLPEDLRAEGVRLNDAELFPFWKRILLKQVMAVVEPVDLAKSSESSLFATAAILVSRKDLSFASVWSPTYWLTLLDILEQKKTELAESLRQGSWTVYQEELKDVPCPRDPTRADELLRCKDVSSLWPRFRVLSCWTTATSRVFAQDVAKRDFGLKIVGKGLWATEGVVTIPFQNHYLLASQSHFYEFEDLESTEIIPAWKLREGQHVSPLLTTAGGLLRYKLSDVLKVSGFTGTTPRLEFLGRADGTDMVGEKISSLQAQEILNSLRTFSGHDKACLFAVQDDSQRRYCAVVDRSSTPDLSLQLENLLAQSFHYKLARELKQLEPAQVLTHPQVQEKYVQMHLHRGMVLGNIKMEALRQITAQELQEHFL